MVYVASGEFGLAIADVTNPSSPVALGDADVPFYGSRLAVNGTLAVVSGGTLGLKVMDVSDPMSPKTLSGLSGVMGAVAMAGQYAYVDNQIPGNPTHDDLIVVNLAVPSAPSIVGRITLPAAAGGIKVVGTYAYLAAGAYGLQVVDVSTPSSPRIVGSVDTPGSALRLGVANGYAYVADSTAVVSIDVHTPSSPAVIGSLATSATNVAVAGNRLYVLSGQQFLIIDVTSPARPAQLSASNYLGAQAIDATTSMAFLGAPYDSSQNKGGLYVENISSPTAPTLMSNLCGMYSSWRAAASGSLAVITGGNLGLKVADVSSASAPKVVGALSGVMGAATMAGQYAYIDNQIPGNPAHDDLIVVNLSTPSNPSIVGRVTLPAPAGGIKVVGSYAYLAIGASGLQVADVSIPSSPRLVGLVDTAGSALRVAVANGYAYVADNTELVSIDVTTPSNPRIVGSLATSATDVAVAGSRLYVIDGMQFKVIDVTNPAAPSLISTTDGHSAQSVNAFGSSYALLATPAADHSIPSGGIWVIDVSNPVQPVVYDQIIVPGKTSHLTVVGSAAYAADAAGTVDVLN
jgi:hypothetical protein